MFYITNTKHDTLASYTKQLLFFRKNCVFNTLKVVIIFYDHTYNSETFFAGVYIKNN